MTTALLARLFIVSRVLVVTTLGQLSSTPEPDGIVTDEPVESDVTGLIPLYISLFITFGALDGSGIFVACDLALQHVNAREDLLPGYELKATVSNSGCDDGEAIKALFDDIFHKPQTLMIVGPTCSSPAQAIATTAKFWNLNMISPTASSPALLNRNKYPTFARIVQSDTSLNPSRIALMKLFNWTRVATIHQNEDLFSMSIDDLLNRMKDNDITVISSESFDDDPKNQVENLKKQDAKIIVGNMYYPMARKVFCEAYKHRMYGEGYVWLLLGEVIEDWYKEPDDTLSCTREELIEAVESSMYIGSQGSVLGKEDSVTIAGITPPEFLTLYQEHLSLFEDYTSLNDAPYGYDAIWAVALALNETVNVLETIDGMQRKLENFTFEDNEMAMIIQDAVNNVKFEGVSGPTSFYDGERMGVIEMEQLRSDCDGGWSMYGSWCYLFSIEPMSLEEALAHCAENTARLIDVQRESELIGVAELWKNRGQQEDISRWWTGLRRTERGDFQWINGSLFPRPDVSWITWDLDEDKMLDRRDLCFTVDLANHLFTGVSCNSSFAFICKKPAEFRQVLFARHDIAKDEIEWLSDIVWPGNKVPLDHTPEVIYTIVESYQGIPLTAYVTACSLAGLGIIMALVFFTFNVYFRQQTYMKLSSPNLNNLIVIGSILIYASTCMTGWDNPSLSQRVFRTLCQMRVWFLSVGFVLSFGSMFSKTWRVHKIASLKNPKRVVVTDRHLFALVAVLLLIDLVILTSWFTVNRMEVEKKYLYPLEDSRRQLIIKPYIKYCTTKHDLYWQGALYCYKALLLIFGTFLAWETRKITIPALNDSKLVGLCVYNVVLLSAIGVGVNLALDTDTAGSFIFTSAIQIFCTTVTLIVIFVPKILSVYKYPEGKPITTMTTVTNVSTVDRRLQQEEQIEAMREEIKQLKAQLAARSPVKSRCGFLCGEMMCALCAKDGSDVEGSSGYNNAMNAVES